MKTAGAYIRVSTDDQLEYSPESQLREIKNYAISHDMIFQEEYVFLDEGISGRKAKKRNAFNQMIGVAKAQPKPFDVILVWKFSRFARNQEESIVYKSLLRKQLDIDVISISEPLIEGPFGSLIERIIEWMDEYYSIRLSGEVTRGMTEKALRGEIQASTPFGYRKEGSKWIIEENEAAIVRYIFEAYNQRNSFGIIAKEANMMGARTKHNNPTHSGLIKYILNNPVYIGTLKWSDIEHENKVPSIISNELWDSVSHKLEVASQDWNKYAKPVSVKQHYLSGILRCADCGQGMTFNSAKESFQCNGYRANKCFSHSVKGTKLEMILISTLENISQTDEYIKNVTTVSATNNLKTINSEIERNKSMLQKARTAYMEGIDTLDEYSTTKVKIVARIEELTLRSKGAASTKEDCAILNKKIKNLTSLLKNSNSSMKEKHDSIHGFIRKIEYKKPDEKLTVFFYI